MKYLKVTLTFLFIYFSTYSYSQKYQSKIDSILKIYNTGKTPEILANASINLGKLYNNKDTDSAMLFFNKALNLSIKHQLIKYEARALNNIAASYIMKGKLDSSETYFNKVKAILDKVSDYNVQVSYYGDRGILDYYNGNLKQAGVKFEKALTLAIAKKEIQDIIRYSNNTALAFSKTGNNNKAIGIYFKALKSAEEQKDSTHIGMLLNNIGNIYEDMNQYQKALDFYIRSLHIKRNTGSYISLINAHYNIGNLQLEISKISNDSILLLTARKNYDTVIEISNKKDYGNGKLMGLEGLGKIALEKNKLLESKKYFDEILKITSVKENIPFKNLAHLTLGHIEIKNKKFKQAKKHLQKVQGFIQKSGSIAQKKELYSNLSLLNYHNKKYEIAYKYLIKQTELENRLTSDELKNKISFYEVKYETEKKEKEILQQKELLLASELKIKKRNLSVILISSALLIIIIISYALFKKQQYKRMQLQKEFHLKEALEKIKTQNKLQEQRLRISRDLHDNIGSQLTFIISSVDNLKYVSKNINDTLKDKLSSISNFTSDTIFQLRDTIWAMNKSEITFEDLHTRILSFVEKAKTATNNIAFNVDYNITSDISFTSIVGINIFRVIQEAINNTIKYAEATEIHIKMYEKKNSIQFSIVDNGKGFDLTKDSLGNGLSNMEKRIKDVKGKIKINSQKDKGTSIDISIKNNKL